MNASIVSNAAKGLVLTLAEILAATGQVFPLTAGPFAVDVQDPANTIAIIPGSPDQKTPTIFRPNGTGAVGTVIVTVTDQSNNLKGSGSFDVVSPVPPPPAPDTLQVGFTAEP